jgi:two-component system sensor histidine kinase/response regulator
MKRILVIEDDPAVRGVIVDALQTRGWRSTEAGDGEAGLNAAIAELPDLILCDIQMPKLDGFHVLRAIRSRRGMATVPFVFLTGHGEKPMMRQAMELGADDYIVKPFTVSELLAAVEVRFQKQAVIDESADNKLQALRETLTSALPHELVTPLNAILGFAALLADDPRANPEQVHEYALLIKGAGERLHSLISKFLVYAQVELATADFQQRESFRSRPAGPTQDVIQTVAERVVREHNRENDLVLNLAVVEHRVAPSHLERLVREAVDNACRFSTPGTPVEVISRATHNSFELRATDRGRGLTPDQIRQVSANIQFERKLTEQQGTGLGLAICRRLAELYSGTLEIHSSPGTKTELVVQLPFALPR